MSLFAGNLCARQWCGRMRCHWVHPETVLIALERFSIARTLSKCFLSVFISLTLAWRWHTSHIGCALKSIVAHNLKNRKVLKGIAKYWKVLKIIEKYSKVLKSVEKYNQVYESIVEHNLVVWSGQCSQVGNFPSDIETSSLLVRWLSDPPISSLNI